MTRTKKQLLTGALALSLFASAGIAVTATSITPPYDKPIAITAAAETIGEGEHSEHTVSLILSATGGVVGDESIGATLTGTEDWEDMGYTVPTIHYVGVDGTNYDSDDVPTAVGSYKATIRAGEGSGEVTAEKCFEITAGDNGGNSGCGIDIDIDRIVGAIRNFIGSTKAIREVIKKVFIGFANIVVWLITVFIQIR